MNRPPPVEEVIAKGHINAPAVILPKAAVLLLLPAWLVMVLVRRFFGGVVV